MRECFPYPDKPSAPNQLPRVLPVPKSVFLNPENPYAGSGELNDGGVTVADGVLAVVDGMIIVPNTVMVVQVATKLVGMCGRAVTESLASGRTTSRRCGQADRHNHDNNHHN